ncbi:MAG: type II toxin-antitoxin system HicB family antitoxin [Comamonadaceae bacterium]|nr:type II toxin-antitoxin system HicB family antitoxin [Comamonadaceae bacterium]
MNTMTYKGYSVEMSFDTEDKIIVGRVKDIDDIIAFHGESVSEFETAFHSAIDAYMAACEKLDQKPEKPASGKLMLRVDPAVHAAAVKASARSGLSLNKWAEKALQRAATA